MKPDQIMLSERPIHHPNQVMSAKELKTGDKITWNNINFGSSGPETIISFGYYPVQKKLEKIFRTITEKGHVQVNFFTDYGIEPYGTMWNKTNFTIKIKETKE